MSHDVAAAAAARTSAATPRLLERSGQAMTSVAGGQSSMGTWAHPVPEISGGDGPREHGRRRAEADEREQLR
ncbi:hypothetical protein [Streptomyces sp. NPDC057460]|uniref:hypothetical protein n=1 Tax=Streptomyces sp. NPDC057460 TaxID=3346141 RepID=UPI00367FF690